MIILGLSKLLLIIFIIVCKINDINLQLSWLSIVSLTNVVFFNIFHLFKDDVLLIREVHRLVWTFLLPLINS